MFGLFNFDWFKRKQKNARVRASDCCRDHQSYDSGDLTLMSYAMLGRAIEHDCSEHKLTPEAPAASESITAPSNFDNHSSDHGSWFSSDSDSSFGGDSCGGGFDGGDCGGCDGGGD